MHEVVRQRLETELGAFRLWASARRFATCRLVQYCGIEKVGAIDVDPERAEAELHVLICEGYYVGWKAAGNKLILRVWEYGGPEPPWEKVVAEEDIQPVPEVPEGFRDPD